MRNRYIGTYSALHFNSLLALVDNLWHQFRNTNLSRQEERLFHSQMWVKGSPVQFIVENGSQKNLISLEVVKRLGLPTIDHPHPYTIEWLHKGWVLCVSQQWYLPYSIKPFTDEVLCDISPLDVSDVLLGEPYLWKQHAMYESRLRFVIISLGNKLYRIPEVAPPTAISFIFERRNAIRSFPRLGNFSSLWFTLRERIRLGHIHNL